ncbi:hypothetical protein PILCRDRAFT_14020 [Piloderma croceum F 1598]|uniref:Uncharacterized protein n=1 Tax=Piloderma croceum (strain F 1598) TaxID=765440 RepID=A0A0C3F4Y6_PILCF|nr:hypothetical protein PILCRDRAFT_14020 [Piloderma croceum F 1598]
MSYPDPQDSPRDFLDHLRSLNLNAAITAFLHKQTRPPLYGRLDVDKAHEWCDRMDALLGKLNRTMGLQPAAQDVCTALSQLCARTIGDVETQLEMQKNLDEDAAKKLAEEKMAEEKAQLLAKQDEKEKQEKIRKMEQELAEMRGTASAPGADLQPLQYVQQKAGDGDEQDEDEDEEDEEAHSESTAEEPQGTSEKKPKGQVEDARKRLAQIVHTAPCTACVKANKKNCMGPVGQACDHCWKAKKSCSNGGRRRVCDPAVKVEPKSLGDSVPSKRMYSATNTKPIRCINSIDVFNSQGSSKRQKTTSGVRFDGVMVPKPPQPTHRATRKSTQSAKANNSKKSTSELFERLGQEFQAIAKTCEEISEALD